MLCKDASVIIIHITVDGRRSLVVENSFRRKKRSIVIVRRDFTVGTYVRIVMLERNSRLIEGMCIAVDDW